MITRTAAYQVGSEVFNTLREAQIHALTEALVKDTQNGAVGISWNEAAERIVEQADKVLDILTTGPRSKPKARKVNGGKKTRALAETKQ